jgi:hypothetical protein
VCARRIRKSFGARLRTSLHRFKGWASEWTLGLEEVLNRASKISTIVKQLCERA